MPFEGLKHDGVVESVRGRPGPPSGLRNGCGTGRFGRHESASRLPEEPARGQRRGGSVAVLEVRVQDRVQLLVPLLEAGPGRGLDLDRVPAPLRGVHRDRVALAEARGLRLDRGDLVPAELAGLLVQAEPDALWSATILARRSAASKTGPSDEVSSDEDGVSSSGVSEAPASSVVVCSAEAASASGSDSCSGEDFGSDGDAGPVIPGMKAGSNPAPVTGSLVTASAFNASVFNGLLLDPMRCSTAAVWTTSLCRNQSARASRRQLMSLTQTGLRPRPRRNRTRTAPTPGRSTSAACRVR